MSKVCVCVFVVAVPPLSALLLNVCVCCCSASAVSAAARRPQQGPSRGCRRLSTGASRTAARGRGVRVHHRRSGAESRDAAAAVGWRDPAAPALKRGSPDPSATSALPVHAQATSGTGPVTHDDVCAQAALQADRSSALLLTSSEVFFKKQFIYFWIL